MFLLSLILTLLIQSKQGPLSFVLDSGRHRALVPGASSIGPSQARFTLRRLCLGSERGPGLLAPAWLGQQRKQLMFWLRLPQPPEPSLSLRETRTSSQLSLPATLPHQTPSLPFFLKKVTFFITKVKYIHCGIFK